MTSSVNDLWRDDADRGRLLPTAAFLRSSEPAVVFQKTNPPAKRASIAAHTERDFMAKEGDNAPRKNGISGKTGDAIG